MTEPSEKEVEAGARVLHERKGYTTWPHPRCTQCEDDARAALTAAAQVRGGVTPPGRPLKPDEQELIEAALRNSSELVAEISTLAESLGLRFVPDQKKIAAFNRATPPTSTAE